MARISDDRSPNEQLISTAQGGLGAPGEFNRSAQVVTTTQTGQPIGEPFTPANATGDTLISSELQQKSTEERVLVQTRVDYTGLNITDQTTDPISGVPVQVTKSIVPSIGGIASITRTSGGTGYTTATITTGGTPSGGLPAIYGPPVISGGAIVSFPILDPGSGYATDDTITITGDGTGAAFVGNIPSYPSIDTNGAYIDITPIDKWKSVQFASKIPLDQTGLDALAITIPGTMAFPWPQTLLSITLFCDIGLHSESASGTFHSVTIGGGVTFNGGIGLELTPGLRSNVVSSLKRTFWKGSPTITDTITKIQLSAGNVIIQGGSTSDFTTYSIDETTQGIADDSSSGVSFSAIAIPECLTNSVTVARVGFGGTTTQLTLPASSPLKFNSADIVTADIRVTQWRFGVQVMEVVKLIYP